MTTTKRLAVLALVAAAIATPALAQQTAGQVAGKTPSVAAAPQEQRTPPTPEQRAARFDRADANKDGKLTKAEFTATLPARAADRADKMWSRLNPTGKDSMTKAEYLAAPMGHGGHGAAKTTSPS
jgi:hypothetical protein